MFFSRQTGLAHGVLSGPHTVSPLRALPDEVSSFSGALGSPRSIIPLTAASGCDGVERRTVDGPLGRVTEVDASWMLRTLLQEGCDLLRPLLSVSDVLCVRMTCRAAWRTIARPSMDEYCVATQAALDRHWPLLRLALHEFTVPAPHDAVQAAARAGMIVEVELMLQRTPAAAVSAVVGAIEGGARPGCERLFRLLWIRVGRVLSCKAIARVSATIAATGNVAQARILAASGHRLSSRYLATAATSGSIPLLSMILAGRIPAQPHPIAAAARTGHLHVVVWLRELGAPWDAEATAGAAAGGFVELLNWLFEHGCPTVIDEVASRAAQNNHTSVLSWLADRPYLSWDAEAASTVAARYKQWDSVSFIHSFAGYLSPTTADYAASDNNMEMLRHSLDCGGKLTARGVRMASLHGHLNVLHLAHELTLRDTSLTHHKPPLFDEMTANYAKRGHHHHVLEFLVRIQCPGIHDNDTTDQQMTSNKSTEKSGQSITTKQQEKDVERNRNAPQRDDRNIHTNPSLKAKSSTPTLTPRRHLKHRRRIRSTKSRRPSA
mmetsp:Transcript_8947/g.28589  ORF Transcript_8947/g.28589 Transcript_8947/m.28589 type:complete len:549 (-) Transcript_8947:27-1673(-)